MHFESVTHPAPQSSFRAGDFPPPHHSDFLALAERDISTYLGKLLEAVPLASGFAPIQFVSEPLGRTFHGIRIYKNHRETLDTDRSRTSSRWAAKCDAAIVIGRVSVISRQPGPHTGLIPGNIRPYGLTARAASWTVQP